MAKIVILITFAFLLGSVPVGAVIAKFKSIDLRKVGSGNIGATNVLRAMGRGPAIITLIGDILKGTISLVIARHFLHNLTMEGIVGLAAVLGHNFSVFLRFRGGKGVATSIGVLLAYAPKAAVVTILIWLAVVFVTKYSSLGAIVSFGFLPLSVYILAHSTEKLVVSVLMATLLIVRHSANIGRLIRGTESKIGAKAT